MEIPSKKLIKTSFQHTLYSKSSQGWVVTKIVPCTNAENNI